MLVSVQQCCETSCPSCLNARDVGYQNVRFGFMLLGLQCSVQLCLFGFGGSTAHCVEEGQ